MVVAFFMIDARLGRRQTLLLGSVFMFVSFFILAGMIYGIQKDNGGALTVNAIVDAKGYVAMVMVYLFAVG